MARNGFRSRFSIAILLSGMIAGTLTLFEPLKSEVVNWSEIGIGVAELLTRLATPLAIAFLAVAVLAMLLTAIAPSPAPRPLSLR